MIEHWLWLADRPRLGAIRAGELLARFGSAEAIYQTSDLPTAAPRASAS